MSEPELQRNPVLTDYTVRDLNKDPKLPYEDNTFDVITNVVSVDYLNRPLVSEHISSTFIFLSLLLMQCIACLHTVTVTTPVAAPFQPFKLEHTVLSCVRLRPGLQIGYLCYLGFLSPCRRSFKRCTGY